MSVRGDEAWRQAPEEVLKTVEIYGANFHEKEGM